MENDRNPILITFVSHLSHRLPQLIHILAVKFISNRRRSAEKKNVIKWYSLEQQPKSIFSVIFDLVWLLFFWPDRIVNWEENHSNSLCYASFTRNVVNCIRWIDRNMTIHMYLSYGYIPLRRVLVVVQPSSSVQRTIYFPNDILFFRIPQGLLTNPSSLITRSILIHFGISKSFQWGFPSFFSSCHSYFGVSIVQYRRQWELL